MVERQLPKLYVVGSIPIARSNTWPKAEREPQASPSGVLSLRFGQRGDHERHMLAARFWRLTGTVGALRGRAGPFMIATIFMQSKRARYAY